MNEDWPMYWLVFGAMMMGYLWGAITGVFWEKDWGDILIGGLSFATGSLTARWIYIWRRRRRERQVRSRIVP